MQPLPIRKIASHYLPSRYHYWYSLSKLAMDPLYEAMRPVFAGSQSPLLDVGCGIGLLLHSLRASGANMDYTGIDIDGEKLEIAKRSVHMTDSRTRFELCDLSVSFPQHRGSVALLDVLQYLEPPAQRSVLERAAQCVGPGGKLVIRGGLDDGSWRAALTRSMDRFGHAVRWMRSSFKAQPKPADLSAQLAAHGLRAEFTPLWGRTPFNNWLVIAHPA